nr:MAG TPA: hypothetical protein [Caudoviricetes sp.]
MINSTSQCIISILSILDFCINLFCVCSFCSLSSICFSCNGVR